MKVRFHLPDFADKFRFNLMFLTMLENSPELFREGVEIASVYGIFPPSLWNGGRVQYGMTDKNYVKGVIKAYNSRGIPLRFTFTNPMLEKKHLSDEFCNMVMHLADNGMNECIVMSPILEDYIRKNYPNYKLTSSTCKRITDPEKQGKLAMSEVFIDTMVICTMTALVIIVSGTDFCGSDFSLTVSNAYSVFLGSFGRLFTSLCLTLFSLCTLTGWFFIGEKSFACLFPEKTLFYKCLYLLCAYLGTQFSLQTVWDLSDLFNALMAIPNIIGVLLLSKQISPPKFRRLRDG